MRLGRGTVALVAVTGLAAGSPAAHASGSCTTPASADGHEPPCNPSLASSEWPIGHRGTYQQDSTPLPGPRAGDRVAVRHTRLTPGTMPVIAFSPPYPDGTRVAWVSEGGAVTKVDATSGRVLATTPTGNEPRGLASGGLGGVYTLLDRQGRFVLARGRALEVYADASPGVAASAITRVARLDIPAELVCGSDDGIVGLTALYGGGLAFATAHGVVGAVEGNVAEASAADVHAASINGPGCAGGDELVTNSIAADENDAIYTVTDHAQYRHDWTGTELRQTWRVAYASDGPQGGIRLGSGSGSSPTLMGTDGDDDRFVAITDGQEVMHLLLLWRDEIPAGWQPIAPGADRRVACDVRIDFGDPDIAAVQSEQSVVVRGTGAIVVNNSLDGAGALLPPGAGPLGALISGNPRVAPHGMQRVDWDPAARSCRTTWVNGTVSVPNAIPTASAGSGMVYAVGQRDGVWGLEGVELATGASALWAPSGRAPWHNSLYAQTEVVRGREIWTGTAAGIDRYVPLGGRGTGSRWSLWTTRRR